MKSEVITRGAVESLLQRRGKLSEAQLFGAVMSEKIADHASPEAAQQFRTAFRKVKRELRETTGSRGIVNAAISSLDVLVAGGKISRDCARVLINESWTLSQLDNNPENVASRREMGVNVSRSFGVDHYNQRNSAYQCGELPLTEVTNEMLVSQRVSSGAFHPKEAGRRDSLISSLSGTASVSQNSSAAFGTSPIYQRGFLFKPVSDSTGNVAILMPPSLTGKVKSVSIQSSDSLETGAYGGIGNGSREHFRFKKPGSSYSEDLSVVVMLRDGTTHNVRIPNPGLRYEVQ